MRNYQFAGQYSPWLPAVLVPTTPCVRYLRVVRLVLMQQHVAGLVTTDGYQVAGCARAHHVLLCTHNKHTF